MQPRPSYLANRQIRSFEDFIGGLGMAQPPRISIKGDRFTLLDETGMAIAEASLTVDVVIVGVNKNPSRIYYDPAKPYAGGGDAPLCWSDNGVGPSKACSTPQAPTCASCPNAVWGSAISTMTQKGVPACSTQKKLGVLVSGQDGLFLLSVPPASLGNYKQYMSQLAKMPAAPEEVITRVKIENKELHFDVVDWVPETYLGYIQELIDNDETASIVNKFDEARDPAQFQALPAPTPMTGQIEPPPPQAPSPVAGRRPGRPPKVIQASPPPAPPPQAAPAPSQPPAFGAPLPPNMPPSSFGFGVAAPVAPDPRVQNLLDNAFNLPRKA